MTEWHVFVIAVAAWLLSYVKVPFKSLTSKISDSVVRKRVNKLIILLPIMFSFAGVSIDMAIFGWAANDMMIDFVCPGINAAGISIIIYNALEKVLSGGGSPKANDVLSLIGSLAKGDETKEEDGKDYR